MPEDINNVSSVRLSNWTFPSNYNTFNIDNRNVTMTFQINTPYNPGENMYTNPTADAIFQALYSNLYNDYSITIEEGFYIPHQMVTELTNKMNEAITNYIITYFEANGYTDLVSDFYSSGGYTDFIVVYNSVSQKIWFGNRSSGFLLTNSTRLEHIIYGDPTQCLTRNKLQNSSNWGLPGNLGLSRCDTLAVTLAIDETKRFYYGNVGYGDNGYWLIPNATLPLATVSYIECPFKINLMGPSHFYMELMADNISLNNIDEIAPFNISTTSISTNATNGIVNSSFAKIAIPTIPISQWFDRDSDTYKYIDPPAQRLRNLKIRLRYHDGQLVQFGVFDYTFTLEFSIFQAEQLKQFSTYKTVGF